MTSQLGNASLKVSVLMITYNHEKYIEQAVRSVMTQQTNFEYEVVIGEDCSTDRTREILLQLEEEYCSSGRIRLILNERNLGPGKNFYNVYNECRGEYIAFLEGDDYWSDRHKLQRQADMLDAEPDASLCFHSVLWFDEDGKVVGESGAIAPRTSCDFYDLLSHKAKFPHTSSMLVRKSWVQLPAEIQTFAFVDRVLCFLCAERGKFVYIDKHMSMYRIHAGGIYSGIDDPSRVLNFIDVYAYLDKRYDYKYSHHFQLGQLWLRLSIAYWQNGKKLEARRALLNAALRCARQNLNIKSFAYVSALVFLPPTFLGLYRSLKRGVKKAIGSKSYVSV